MRVVVVGGGIVGLATARALSDLAHALLEAAADDIEQVTDKPAHLRG